MERPLILITNDDGIASPGLRAVVGAVYDLGDILVVAPKNQQSAASRHFLAHRTRITETVLHVDGQQVSAFAVDSSPAQTVRWGLLTLAPRKPTIAIAGINYGENLGVGITISGTVGAAIEAASFSIPSLAVSLETEQAYHLSISDEVDFSAAAHFTRFFAMRVLRDGLPPGVDILNINVPQSATPETGCRITRVSRQQYFHSTVEEDENGRRLTGYRREIDMTTLEPDSDIYAVVVDRLVSVSPITIDLTAKVDLGAVSRLVA